MDAQDRGETGLTISLSKPFQRLLNYSMLFRALLFHTDPWMLEYEGALQLVTEVEDIIRDIEDAKDEKEKCDKTRDIFARIKGLDKVKQFAVPKPSRVLVEEVMLNPKEDVLRSGGGGIGSRKDVWLVVFNDVVLRCQRTGLTSLPLGAAQSPTKTNFLFELQGSSKFDTTSRQNPSTQPRNLYKFIKVSASFFYWTQSDGVVIRLRIGLLATPINLVKEWSRWKRKLCRGFVQKELLS